MIDFNGIRRQRRMGPEVMTRPWDKKDRLLIIGRIINPVSSPGIDLTIGKDDAGGGDLVPSVSIQSLLDLVVYLVG